MKPDLEYSVVAVEGEPRKLILASALVETIAGEGGAGVRRSRRTVPGEQLLGLRYLPPFDYYYKTRRARHARHSSRRAVSSTSPGELWRPTFVTIDSGTGVVHQAPAFGEVDFDVLQAEQARFVDGEGPALICSVGARRHVHRRNARLPGPLGQGLRPRHHPPTEAPRACCFHQEQYLHDYPFCWRAEEDPLIQYPRKSWFIRTTQFKDKMLANNSRINWLPEHIRDGRFGNFLETNVDWALSRERYWGTPLPIWVCEKTGYMEAVGSYDELLAKPGVAGHRGLGGGRRRPTRTCPTT